MTQEVNLFELASIQKWRFTSSKGQLTVEDLWYMPLAKGAFCLDAVAVKLFEASESSEKVSFVVTPRPGTKLLAQKLELVKYIIATRIQSDKDSKDTADRKVLKQKIAGIIDSKKDDALVGKTVAELEAMITDL